MSNVNIMEAVEDTLDLGDSHSAEWYGWNPDRELNPQFSHLPDVEKFCLAILHT